MRRVNEVAHSRRKYKVLGMEIEAEGDRGAVNREHVFAARETQEVAMAACNVGEPCI